MDGGVEEFQHFQTPDWCCEMMASMVPRACQTVLEPTPGQGNLVRSLSGYRITAPVDFWSNVEDTDRFDCIVMNPPFSPMSVGYKILTRCMSLSDNIVALMPWLTIINGERRTKSLCEFGLKSVTHLPRSTFKGARIQSCILEMQRGHNEGTILRFAMGKT